MEQSSTFQKFDDLQISSQGKAFLKESSKWANFIAIMGFIGISFMILFSLVALIMGGSNSMMSNKLPFGGTTLIAVIYLVIAGLYFLPVYYLYKFAGSTKIALNNNDSVALNNALGFLKSHYKFIGIMIVVLLVIYALIFLFAIFGALSHI